MTRPNVRTSVLQPVNVDHCLGKSLWGFLRKVVTDTARYIPVLIFAREFMGIGRRVRVRSSIGVTLQRDGWNANRRGLCQLLFEIIVLLLSFAKSDRQSPIYLVFHSKEQIQRT